MIHWFYTMPRVILHCSAKPITLSMDWSAQSKSALLSETGLSTTRISRVSAVTHASKRLSCGSHPYKHCNSIMFVSVHTTLFTLLLRRGEFLEAQIIPERIDIGSSRSSAAGSRLTMASCIPCFTSHVPRSCSSGRHSSNSDKSSATCLESRMWRASPQSITRRAIFKPAPARFVRPVTSTTPLTGPL